MIVSVIPSIIRLSKRGANSARMPLSHKSMNSGVVDPSRE